MQTAEQKVSVIVPVYNAEKYLRQALDSILKQDYPNREIILVENMSDDGSMKICQEYEKANKEIRLFREKKIGPGDARNTGLKKALGTYIMFVDADDYLPDEKIMAKFVNIAQQTASDVVICNYARLWNGKLLEAAEHRVFSEQNPDTEDFQFKSFFSVGHLSYVWGKLYRKSFLDQHALHFPSLEYAEDKLFNIQCYMSGAVYTYIEDRGYVYRKNDDSISYQYKPESMKCWMKIVSALQQDMVQNTPKKEVYEAFIRYLIFFAAFFDAEMEYTANHHSTKAVRRCLKAYGRHPDASKYFKELMHWKRTSGLSQWFWRWMLWGFSVGMRYHLYYLLALGVKLLIDLRIDERLSDTGLRE